MKNISLSLVSGIRHRLTIGLFSVLIGASTILVQAQDMNGTPAEPSTPPPATPAPAATPAPEGDTPLELTMKNIVKASKELTKDLKTPVDTDKDKYLALATTLKTEAAKAHDLVPKKAADLPADQKDAFVAAYQKDMDTFGQTVDTLSQAIKDGKWDDAQKALATLKQEEASGHKAYRKKD
jgi:cytochrome c556